MKETKKFISPQAWFSMRYPKEWFEFEDGEGSFLFYNPENWEGNFRISAERGYTKFYGEEILAEELKSNKDFRLVSFPIGKAYFSSNTFEENEERFTSYQWMYALDEMFFECTFTTNEKGEYKVAEEILKSIEVRDLDTKYPAELIPIRLSEIYRVNNDYEWVTNFVKEKLAVDFQGIEEDISNLDKLKADDLIGKKKREQWQAVGIALTVILINEVEGLEWFTLVDGNREDPVLVYGPTNVTIDPMKLVWSKVKAGEEFTITQSYQEVLESISSK